MKKFSFEPNLKAAIGLIQLLLNQNQPNIDSAVNTPNQPNRPITPPFSGKPINPEWDEDNTTL